MTQPAVPDFPDWQRHWTIDAGSVSLQPVTRRIAQAVLDGGPITRKFEGCVEIGYSLAPSARGKGIGTTAVAVLVGRLAAVPRIRRLTAVTSAQNAASRRLLERQGFRITGPLPATDLVRYTLTLS
jgi:RimJ/RimL family protein N-acetyltransferase